MYVASVPYPSVEDALRLQSDLLVVVLAVHHLLQPQETDGTHLSAVTPQDANLQFSGLSAIRQNSTQLMCTQVQSTQLMNKSND